MFGIGSWLALSANHYGEICFYFTNTEEEYFIRRFFPRISIEIRIFFCRYCGLQDTGLLILAENEAVKIVIQPGAQG